METPIAPHFFNNIRKYRSLMSPNRQGFTIAAFIADRGGKKQEYGGDDIKENLHFSISHSSVVLNQKGRARKWSPGRVATLKAGTKAAV